MRGKPGRRALLLPLAGLVLPALLVGCFSLVRGNRAFLDVWVFRVLSPLEQTLGRIWSVFPFSGMELMIGGFLLFQVFWLVRALVLAVRGHTWRGLVRRLLVLAACWLWLWAGVDWLWNAAYGASGFSRRSGLEARPSRVEDLAAVTRFYGENAARLSTRVARDEEGHFAEDVRDCFRRGAHIYGALEEEFPCLKGPHLPCKGLLCSPLQSRLGFTGMYFPFTGEANVNTDAPACLLPATIGHEMAHQRMVASELECNFIGVAACVTCDDPVFQYSGYLMGLIHLCNALWEVDPDAWREISAQCFTPELAADWNDNNAYWAAMESPVEEAAGGLYDSYLKGNDQPMGMRSYGACVDLLVTWTLEREDLTLPEAGQG